MADRFPFEHSWVWLLHGHSSETFVDLIDSIIILSLRRIWLETGTIACDKAYFFPPVARPGCLRRVCGVFGFFCATFQTADNKQRETGGEWIMGGPMLLFSQSSSCLYASPLLYLVCLFSLLALSLTALSVFSHDSSSQ